jgi:hypothetical protein
MLSSIILKSKIGDTDFINPTLTSLLNLALKVGVVIPVPGISHEMSFDHLLTKLLE